MSVITLSVICCLPAIASAEDAAPPNPAELAAKLTEQKVIMDTVWTMMAGMLVFFMNAGFALLEAGLCRAKNASTILGKTSSYLRLPRWRSGFWASI